MIKTIDIVRYYPIPCICLWSLLLLNIQSADTKHLLNWAKLQTFVATYLPYLV